MPSSNLGYPFDYGDRVNSRVEHTLNSHVEDTLNPETVQPAIVKIIISLPFIWSVYTKRGEAIPFPAVNGFPQPIAPIGRLNRNNCRNFGILSRFATSAGKQYDNNQHNSYYEASLNCTFEKRQLQKKFEHAIDFGVEGNYNLANSDLYQRKIIEHMKSTHACLGTYHGKQEVYHYYDPTTNLNVMIDRNTNKFVSGWRLSPEQILNLKKNGNIQ